MQCNTATGDKAMEQEARCQQPAEQTPQPLPSASPDWRHRNSGQALPEPPSASDRPYQYSMPDANGMGNQATDAHLHSLHEGLLFWRQTQQRMWGDSPWPDRSSVYSQTSHLPDSNFPGRYPYRQATSDEPGQPNLNGMGGNDGHPVWSNAEDASMRDLIAARRHTAPAGPGSRTSLRRMQSASTLPEGSGRAGSETGAGSKPLRRTGSQNRPGMTPGGLARLSEESSTEAGGMHDRPDGGLSQPDGADTAEPGLLHQSSWREGDESGAEQAGEGRDAVLADWRVRQRGRTGSEPGGPRRATADARLPPRHMSVDAIRAGVAR